MDIMRREGIFLDVGAGDSPFGAEQSNVVRLDPNYRLEPPEVRKNCVSGLCEELPFRDNVFSTVLACFVVQHTADVSVSLSELLRVCCPDGIVAIIPVWRPSRWPRHPDGIKFRCAYLRNVDSFMDALIVHCPDDADIDTVANAIAASGALVPPRLTEWATRIAMQVITSRRGTTRVSVTRRLRHLNRYVSIYKRF